MKCSYFLFILAALMLPSCSDGNDGPNLEDKDPESIISSNRASITYEKPYNTDINWFFNELSSQQKIELEKLLVYQDYIVENYFNKSIDNYLLYFANGNTNFDSVIFRENDYISSAIKCVIYSELKSEFFTFPNTKYHSTLPLVIDPIDDQNLMQLSDGISLINDEDIMVNREVPPALYIENPQYIQAWNEVIAPHYQSNFFRLLSFSDDTLREIHRGIEHVGTPSPMLIASGILCSDISYDIKRLSTACYLTSLTLLFNDKFDGENGFQLIGHLYNVDDEGKIPGVFGCPPSESIGAYTKLPSRLLPPPSTILNPSPEVNDDQIYTLDQVTNKPIWPGCEEIADDSARFYCLNKGIGQFVANEFKYPEEAKQMVIQGKMYISFTIDKDGEVSDIFITRGVHELLDEEAIRVVKLLPTMIPAKLGGQPVRMRYTLPINASLK